MAVVVVFAFLGVADGCALERRGDCAGRTYARAETIHSIRSLRMTKCLGFKIKSHKSNAHITEKPKPGIHRAGILKEV